MKLTVIALASVAAILLSLPARADQCGSSSCFFNSNVVDVYYGTFTLLSPTGAVLSTENVVTAQTDLSLLNIDPATPQPIVAEGLDANVLSQFQSDIQSSFASLPSFLFTGLASLEDANGFGSDVNADPTSAVTSFDDQLASFAGSAGTVSDTGFQAPLISQAYCDYLNSLAPGLCAGSPPGDPYSFTYQVGPVTIGSDIYTSLTNFQVFARDVTVQETSAVPEPASLGELAGSFAILLFVRTRRRFARA